MTACYQEQVIILLLSIHTGNLIFSCVQKPVHLKHLHSWISFPRELFGHSVVQYSQHVNVRDKGYYYYYYTIDCALLAVQIILIVHILQFIFKQFPNDVVTLGQIQVQFFFPHYYAVKSITEIQQYVYINQLFYDLIGQFLSSISVRVANIFIVVITSFIYYYF